MYAKLRVAGNRCHRVVSAEIVDHDLMATTLFRRIQRGIGQINELRRRQMDIGHDTGDANTDAQKAPYGRGLMRNLAAIDKAQ